MNPYLQKIETKQIVLIMGGFLMLFFIAIMTYLISPQFKEYRNTNKKYVQLKQTVLNERDLLANLQAEKNAVTQLSKKLHGDLESLPPNQIEAYIIGKLQQVSWQHNIELAGINPSFQKRTDSFQEIEFDINVSGDYFDIYSWITSLNNELAFTIIKQFEMHPAEQDKAVPRLKANLTMVAYLSAKKQ